MLNFDEFILNYLDYGWEEKDSVIYPERCNQPIPNDFLKVCACKKGCKGRCGCKKFDPWSTVPRVCSESCSCKCYDMWYLWVLKHMKTIFEYFSVWTFPWYINYSKRMVDRGGAGVPLVISLDMAPNRVKTSQLVKMNAIIEFLVWKNVSMQIFRF